MISYNIEYKIYISSTEETNGQQNQQASLTQQNKQTPMVRRTTWDYSCINFSGCQNQKSNLIFTRLARTPTAPENKAPTPPAHTFTYYIFIKYIYITSLNTYITCDTYITTNTYITYTYHIWVSSCRAGKMAV